MASQIQVSIQLVQINRRPNSLRFLLITVFMYDLKPHRLLRSRCRVATGFVRFNQKVKLLWFDAGSGEGQFVKMMDDSRKKLEGLGIKSTGYVSQGTFHEWHTWRRHLNEFVPLLFKPRL